MSLRTSLRGLTASLRSLSTTTRLTNAAAASSSQPQASSPPSDGFGDLSSLLADVPNTSTVLAELNRDQAQSSASSSNNAPSIIDPSARRGYTVHGLPPDTDPLLDLVTNLVMKHGRKAEARSRVSRLLSLM